MSEKDIDEFINSSVVANQEIYRLLNSDKKDLKTKQQEGFGGDVSIKADLLAEEIFIKHLQKYGKIFSEESGFIGSGQSTITIDPLDGSDNFLSGFPYYGTSVCFSEDNKTKVAVITNLSNGDIFIKTKNYFKKGNLFQNDFINVEKNSYSKIGLFEKGYKSEIVAKKLRENGVKYRVPGAVALSMAYAYEVSFVLFEGKPREFDICAGRFMCEEINLFENDKYLLISKDNDMFMKLMELL